MQYDGNFIIYHGDVHTQNTALWGSDTYYKGDGPYRLTMQEDGNLVLYDTNNDAQWASSSQHQGEAGYRAVM